ncbi:rhodanese-like domain-containing protein [Methanogenium sp. S4BF]|uniref:rhodanese-like domain-containing protein n=1 Tax=Methanogenium sp. S4BF TaxID=1789226 RepID=UPI002417B49D|nr:rhodanese-like domain-containing protein [Methanogenium sp. S4BF]WFN34407.1 rhodanese-like domain-containing protein [Methanogenium sp. S4BF]
MDLIAEEASSFAAKAFTLVIDVSAVSSEGHIPGVVNMPPDTPETELKNRDKSRLYRIYCHTDAANAAGAEAFMDAGYPMAVGTER